MLVNVGEASLLAMASRGRGRGLISEAGRKTQSAKKQSPRTPRSFEELTEYLYSLNEGNIHIHGAEFADMVIRFADNESKLAKTVDLIFDTTIESRDYSKLGGTVCQLIVDRGTQDGNSSTVGSDFKQKLLRRFQSELKANEEIRARSIEQWLGIFAFLCEVYFKIKVGGAPISVVGNAILKYTDKMLANPDIIDDEVDTICMKLKKCGKLLEHQDAGMMEKIITALRKQVISSKSSCQRRCVIMELIELKQLGWNDISGKLDDFYIDAITDAIVEDEIGGEN